MMKGDGVAVSLFCVPDPALGRQEGKSVLP